MRSAPCTALAMILGLSVTTASAAVPETAVKDVVHLADPSGVILEWYTGDRVRANWKARLMNVDVDVLLEGFRNRPGKHPWIGEHAGKWLHAATLSWAYSRDSDLKEKLDLVVSGLLKTQEPDGYLGTYSLDRRFGLYEGADWDVWVHKYCILGLLTYHRYRGVSAALDGARRAADLLVDTFGPGRKDIIQAGTHVGMAATSVLEPIVLLYEVTGDEKYLSFAKYLVGAYEHEGGPRIMSSLLKHGSVHKTANAKAYEMLSNLVGLCKLYRVTGEKKYLSVCEVAWKDIVENRMYITGGISYREHFQEDGVLPGTGPVAETCANVTWEQLNVQLLRLTGEAKYADVLERLVYNHLFAAQKLDGTAFCYFTPLEGEKSFSTGVNCCTSSGPRGVAMLPTFAFTARENSLDANLFVRGEATFKLSDGETYRIEQRTRFPSGNKFFFRVVCEGFSDPVKYRVRVPSWTTEGGRFEDATWREFTQEDRIEFDMTPRIVRGRGGNEGLVAILRGPNVYCLDMRYNPGLKEADLEDNVHLAGDTLEQLGLEAFGAADRALYTGQALLKARGLVPGPDGRKKPVELHLSDFATAGTEGTRFRVWLPVADPR